MDFLLAKLNIYAESTRGDLAKQLVHKPLGLLKQVRTDLFEYARACKLAHPNDIVQRQKRGTGPRLEIKLANDIDTCIPSEKRYHIPRTLLRNGKKPQECLHQPGINNLESEMTQFLAQMTLSQPSADGQPNALTTRIVVSIVKLHVWKLFKTTRLRSNPNVTRVVLLWTIMMLVLAIFKSYFLHATS